MRGRSAFALQPHHVSVKHGNPVLRVPLNTERKETTLNHNIGRHTLLPAVNRSCSGQGGLDRNKLTEQTFCRT